MGLPTERRFVVEHAAGAHNVERKVLSWTECQVVSKKPHYATRLLGGSVLAAKRGVPRKSNLPMACPGSAQHDYANASRIARRGLISPSRPSEKRGRRVICQTGGAFRAAESRAWSVWRVAVEASDRKWEKGPRKMARNSFGSEWRWRSQ